MALIDEKLVNTVLWGFVALGWCGIAHAFGSFLSVAGCEVCRCCFMRMRLQFRQWKKIPTVLFLLFG
jgi:hypothetical protein